MSFNDFVHEYKLGNEATSNLKIYQVPLSLSLNDAGIYLRERPFPCAIGNVNLHPSEGIH